MVPEPMVPELMVPEPTFVGGKLIKTVDFRQNKFKNC